MDSLVLNSGIISTIGDWIGNLFITLFMMIDSVVYMCINWMYRIFMLIAKVNLFENSNALETIINRMYIIVGIAMLFIFAYNLILLIMNPEGKQLGNMANVVKKAIVSIIVVIFLPLIFGYLTTIQNHILESNVIGQIILGTSNDSDYETINKYAGVKASLDIFSAFYHPNDQTVISCKNEMNDANSDSKDICAKYVNAYNTAYNNGKISEFIWDDDLREELRNDKMEYTYILSTVAGVLALWMFVSFALDIGVRVAKMAFYEIISPIPVMMRILPNDKMFDKWFNGIKETFLSIFVRLAIIYFCVYAITLVPDIVSNIVVKAKGESFVLASLATVVVILGILQFAQEAPKLISDLFGGSGNVKFGVRKKLTDNKLAMAGMGLGASGAVGLASNVRKMFSADRDPETNKIKKVHFNPSNPFRGVVKGAAVGGIQGYKSKTFGELGGAITEGRDATSDVNNKYKSRRQTGADAIHKKNLDSSERADDFKWGDKARGIPVIGKMTGAAIDAVTESMAGRGVNVKNASINAGKSVLDYLNAGSETSSAAEKNINSAINALDKTFKSFSRGISPIEDTAKAWREAYDVDGKIPKALNAKLEELIANGKNDKITAKSVQECTREEVLEGIKEWQKDSKMSQYESNFNANEKALDAFRDTIMSALKEAAPYMSVDAKAKIDFDKIQNSSGEELARALDSAKTTLNNEKKYIDAMRFQKAEEGKKS